jgi:integrase
LSEQQSLLGWKSIEYIPKAKIFLESIQRNSKDSRRVYQTGLAHFRHFLQKKYAINADTQYTLETILESIYRNEINVYDLLDNFVSFMMDSTSLSVYAIKIYITSVRSYFAYYDIDIIPSKFKRKVKMPKIQREDEEPLDVSDIRKILLCCSNRRLKVYILFLASGGMRAIEGLATRLKDIDFSIKPTKIHIRKEYAKTRVARDIYISDEATHYLKQWLEWKYGNKYDDDNKIKEGQVKTFDSEDLIFSVYTTKIGKANPKHIYIKIIDEFAKLLSVAGLDERKDDGRSRRRKITLHSLRRFVKTVISDQTNQDYSEWFLGHSKSPYYTKKEQERRQLYATKCTKYLTFLDYQTLETTGKNIEAKLQEKDKEIQAVKEKYEQDLQTIRDEMENKFQQILTKIDVTQIK